MVISGARHLEVAAHMVLDLSSMLKKRASKYPRDQDSRKMMEICIMTRPTSINLNEFWGAYNTKI
jgi:methylthioribose-1-phosphate isomerase